MATEKRLIDTDVAIERAKESDKIVGSSIWETSEVVEFLEDCPIEDAVDVEKYIELREQYDRIFIEVHELRDAFVDYVCSGVPNPSPFCKNMYPGCCDSRGWCKNDDKCKGFNPAKIFLDGDGNG